MKKITFFVFAVLNSVLSPAQAPAIEWQRAMGGSGLDLFEQVLPTSDGGWIAAGLANSTDGDLSFNDNPNEMWLVKFNSLGTVEWENTYGGSNQEYTFNLLQTPDGGYIMSTSTDSDDGDITGFKGVVDIWVVKIDSLGTIEWQKTYGSPGGERIDRNCMRLTPDGGYIFAGAVGTVGGDVTGVHGMADIWVVKIDAEGNILWTNTLGGSSGDFAVDIAVTQDDGLIIAGTTQSDDGDVTGYHGMKDFWIVKLDAAGTLQWQKALGGSGLENWISDEMTLTDTNLFVMQASDGGYVVTGASQSVDGDITPNAITNGSENIWVVKLDDSGEIQWDIALGRSDSDYANIGNPVMETPDMGYIISGHSAEPIYGYSDMYIAKLDTAGFLLWEEIIGGTKNESSYDMIVAPNGGIVLIGSSSSSDGDVTNNYGSSDFWVVKMNGSGTIEWQKSMGGSSTDYAYAGCQTLAGNYILAGLTMSSDGDVTGFHPSFAFDAWIVKLSPEALSAPDYSLYPMLVYPNPASSIITLQAENNTVPENITITDVLGKTVLEKQNVSVIDISALQAGTYFIKAQYGSNVLTQKLVKQ